MKTFFLLNYPDSTMQTRDKHGMHISYLRLIKTGYIHRIEILIIPMCQAGNMFFISKQPQILTTGIFLQKCLLFMWALCFIKAGGFCYCLQQLRQHFYMHCIAIVLINYYNCKMCATTSLQTCMMILGQD